MIDHTASAEEDYAHLLEELDAATTSTTRMKLFRDKPRFLVKRRTWNRFLKQKCPDSDLCFKLLDRLEDRDYLRLYLAMNAAPNFEPTVRAPGCSREWSIIYPPMYNFKMPVFAKNATLWVEVPFYFRHEESPKELLYRLLCERTLRVED